MAWQAGHGLSLAVFPYLPGSALALWPLAQLPLGVSFWIWGVLMLLCAFLAARIGARIYELPMPVAVASTFAWAPVTGAVVIGQNSPLGLLLALVAIEGLVGRGKTRGGGQRERIPGTLPSGRELLPRRRALSDDVRAGLGSGLLLYKPTFGLPLVGLLVLRGRGRALALAGAVAVGWYATGIVASGGNVAWPGTWFATITGYIAADAGVNADKAVSVPGLISRLPLPSIAAVAAAILVAAAAIPRLIRAPLPEAAAGACLVGVAASPHAWSYDAALLLPIIWWSLAGGIAEPWRTRLIVGAYVLAPFWLFSRQTIVSAVAVVVLGAAAIWIAGWWRTVRQPMPALT
jgi:hypothetical protein